MRLRSTTIAGVLALGLAVASVAPAHAATEHLDGDTEVTALHLYGPDDGAVFGNGSKVRFEAGAGWRWWGANASPLHLALQVHRAGGWRTVDMAVRRPGSKPVVLVSPALRTTARSERVRFRVRSLAYRDGTGAVTNTVASTSLAVRVEDQARYTGLRKAVWRDARPYCPTTAVHVEDLPGRAGEFDTGALLLRIDPAVGRYTPLDRRAVALHECAHERQWLDYGGTGSGWATMQKAAERVYRDRPLPAGQRLPYRYEPARPGFTAVEHGADCAAQALNPGGYLGYGGWCTRQELSAGKRLMHGHRY